MRGGACNHCALWMLLITMVIWASFGVPLATTFILGIMLNVLITTVVWEISLRIPDHRGDIGSHFEYEIFPLLKFRE